jgi:surface antigen
LTANILIFAIVGTLIAFNSSSGSANRSSLGAVGGADRDPINPLDGLSAADIAVNVARVTSLPESTSVTNKADSEKARLSVASTDDNVISKPQVVSSGLKSKKDIFYYKTVAGDTVPSVAEKFGITSETIRLSNNLEGDTLTPGMKLVISPVNGLVYRVQSGDTPDSLAARYRADVNEVITFNDVELTGRLKVGELIVIPDGAEPVSSSYSYGSSGFSFGNSPVYSANGYGYDYGWCTWHAAKRRAEIGRPVPTNLGNAITWLRAARLAGLPTGSEPRQGAVVYHTDIGGLGHVAFVEKVNSNGSVWISDMNYRGHVSMDTSSPSTGGWGTVSYRLVQPSELGSLRFIY